MTTAGILERQQDELFDAASRELREEMGSVSIVKFLNAQTEHEAKQNWFAAIERFVGALPSGLFLGAAVAAGKPVLEFASGVVMTVRLWQLLDGRTVNDSWRLMLDPELASVLTDAVGWELWREEWRSALRDRVGGLEILPVIPAGASPQIRWIETTLAAASDRNPDAPGGRGWLVGGIPGPTAQLWFMDRDRAERAAVAFTAGVGVVNALFRDHAGVSHE